MVLAHGELPRDQICKIDRYLRVYGLIPKPVEYYNERNKSPGMMQRPVAENTGGKVTTWLMWVIFVRQVVLCYFDHDPTRLVLGDGQHGVKPYEQINTLMMLYAVWGGLLWQLYTDANENRLLGWLRPYLVFKGFVSPPQEGLHGAMVLKWFRHTRKIIGKMFLFGNFRSIAVSVLYAYLAYYQVEVGRVGYTNALCWGVALTVWNFMGSGAIYVTYGYYESMCYYFLLRFEKVNGDIETLLSFESRLKGQDRIGLMTQILREHNELCSRIQAYNKFWGKFLMYSYFTGIPICLFSLYQALFAGHSWFVCGFFFAGFLESTILLTRISMAASQFSEAAHWSYKRLIPVTFEKYPIDVQIQVKAQLLDYLERTQAEEQKP